MFLFEKKMKFKYTKKNKRKKSINAINKLTFNFLSSTIVDIVNEKKMLLVIKQRSLFPLSLFINIKKINY